MLSFRTWLTGGKTVVQMDLREVDDLDRTSIRNLAENMDGTWEPDTDDKVRVEFPKSSLASKFLLYAGMAIIVLLVWKVGWWPF